MQRHFQHAFRHAARVAQRVDCQAPCVASGLLLVTPFAPCHHGSAAAPQQYSAVNVLPRYWEGRAGWLPFP